MATFSTEPVRDFSRLLLLVLLLSAGACQRATYPMHASSDYAAQPVLPTPRVVDQSAEAPAAQDMAARTSPAINATNVVPYPKRRRFSRQAFTSIPLAASGVRRQLPALRRPLTLRRAPTMSENTKYGLLFFGGGALLVVLGLALLIGVSGGLAVLGGIVFILIGLALALFWLYAIGLGKNMGH